MCVLGLKALSGMERREEFSVREVCRKDVAFPREGEGDSGSGCKDFAGLRDDKELFIHLFILKHIH